jgi:hypothetical protein
MDLHLSLLFWTSVVLLFHQIKALPQVKRICYPVRGSPAPNSNNKTLLHSGKPTSPLIKRLCYPVTDATLQMLTRHQFERLKTHPLAERDNDASLGSGQNAKPKHFPSSTKDADRPQVRELDADADNNHKINKKEAKRICYWVAKSSQPNHETKDLPVEGRQPVLVNATTSSHAGLQQQKLVKICYPVNADTLTMLRDNFPLEASTLHKELNATEYLMELDDKDKDASIHLTVSSSVEDKHLTVEWVVTNASTLQFEVRNYANSFRVR